jgi:hypothetical protein
MAGLVPAISIRKARQCVPYRDRRDKPGDDDAEGVGLVGKSCGHSRLSEKPVVDLPVEQIPIARHVGPHRGIEIGLEQGNGRQIVER